MAYKTKFLHFKTKASYEAERAKTTEGSENRKIFDAYISFIDEGPTICTWGKEYQCDANSLSVLSQELTTEKQDQVFKNLGWNVHIISQSDIDADSSPSNEEKAKRLEATALLVKETSNIYLRGNDDSNNHYFFKVNSSSQIELLRISITTGIIYRTNTQFIDVGSIRYDRAQSLTADQKTMARKNIDAASKEEVLPLTIDISNTSVEDYNIALEAFNSKKPLTIFDSSDPTVRFTSTTIEKETDTNDINIYFSFTGINNDNAINTVGYIAKIKSTGEKTANFASITPSNLDPKPLASVASPGTDNAYSRSDHVHPIQESVNKLTTPRVIAISGAVSGSATFDGSKNISINSTLNGFDASKITSGTLSADRLPNIPIEKLPTGALERMFVAATEAAAVALVTSKGAQDGDVVQVTGNSNQMYFVVDDTATTFANIFRVFTAGTATSVPWSGVTNAPTKLSQFTNDLGFLTSVPAASTTVTGGIKLNGNNSQYLAGDGSFYEINYNEINGTPDIATANTAGLVKPINVITKPTLNSITTTSERYYSVQMSNDGNMFVNVPWTSSSIPSDNVTGSGTSGYLAKFNGTNTITSGPKLSSSSSGLFLRDDGTWQIPFDISINGSGTIDSFSYQLNLNAGTGGISITNDEDNTYSINAVAASTSQFGTVKVGSNITVSSGTISLSKSNVTSALGYTPANTSDIPEIPIALPNPYALTINGTSYTGSSAVSISTSKPLSVRMLTSSTVDAGYSYSCGTSKAISTLNGFSSTNPDSVIISSAKLTFTASNVIKMDGLDDLSGTWYIYCLSYMANSKIAVNGAVYA